MRRRRRWLLAALRRRPLLELLLRGPPRLRQPWQALLVSSRLRLETASAELVALPESSTWTRCRLKRAAEDPEAEVLDP